MKYPDMMRGFDPPPANDLLAEFRRQYAPMVERRIAELRAELDSRQGLAETEEGFEMYQEYKRLQHFEPELHRIIVAFIAEALLPWQKAVSDSFSLRYSTELKEIK